MSFESGPHAMESRERPAVNLLKDFEAAVGAVSAVEAEWTRDDVGVQELDEQALGPIRSQMHETASALRVRLTDVGAHPKDLESFRKRRVGGFQGRHGFNRYRVYGDGTIGLSASHSIDACMKKAKEVGIRVEAV